MSEPMNEFEAALRSVKPAGARVDAVEAAFEAGRRAAASQVRAWRAAAAVMLLIGGAAWLVPGRTDVVPTPQSPPGIVMTVVQTPPAPLPPPPAQSLLMLQRAVREGGLDALPASHLPSPRKVRADETL